MRVDLVVLRPVVAERKQQRLADDLSQSARQEEMPPVGEVGVILLVFVAGDAERAPGGEPAGEGGPRQAHHAHDQLHMRQLGQPDDDRQQVAGRVDETGPELDEGKIAQEREVLLEVPYHPFDDAGIVVGVLQEGRHRRPAANSGPVVAGVIGKSKYIYDLWGDTVNLTSRMESGGMPDTIQVTRSVYDKLKDEFVFESRGSIEVKGKGSVEAWFLKL